MYRPASLWKASISELLAEVRDPKHLLEVGRLGTRLVPQRAVEEEVAAFLARARYERTSGARASKNGNRAGADCQRRVGHRDATAATLRRETRLPGNPGHPNDSPESIAGGAGDRGVCARALRSGHREPAPEGGPGQALQEQGRPDLSGLRARYGRSPDGGETAPKVNCSGRWTSYGVR